MGRKRTRLLAGLAALAAALLAVIVSVMTASVAVGAPPQPGVGMDITVDVKQASLDDHEGDCAIGSTTGAHFIITQVLLADAPSSIEVTLDDGETYTVPRTAYTGFTAHYEFSFPATGLLVTDATAQLPPNWTGQFVLSHYNCAPPPTTPPSSSSSSSPYPPS